MYPRKMKQLKLGVCGSGKGSNFRAVVRTNLTMVSFECRGENETSDVSDAGILSYARDYQIPGRSVLHPREKSTKLEEEVEHDVVRLLQERTLNWWCAPAFMRV